MRMTVASVDVSPPVAAPTAPTRITPMRVAFFAAVVAVFIVNIFACQVVLAPIAADLGLAASQSSYVSTATLLGYALGLLFIVPLADVVENRRLVITMAVTCVAALFLAAITSNAVAFIALCLLIGAASSLIQVLVPLVGALTPAEHRGRVLGNVMSGLMLGIMISRPAATLINNAYGWRALYAMSALLVGLVVIPLRVLLPERKPTTPITYLSAVKSLTVLIRNEPILRARSLSAALVMAAFSMFWTAIAVRLSSAPFHLSAHAIALFGVVGTAGAVAAPITGRMGDRGWTRPASIVSDMILIGALVLAMIGGSALASSPMIALALLVVAAIALDCGLIGDQTLGRRAINLLDPSAIGRRNGLFVGIFFLGGALGSALVGPVSAIAGWTGVCIAGALFGVGALVVSIRQP